MNNAAGDEAQVTTNPVAASNNVPDTSGDAALAAALAGMNDAEAAHALRQQELPPALREGGPTSVVMAAGPDTPYVVIRGQTAAPWRSTHSRAEPPSWLRRWKAKNACADAVRRSCRGRRGACPSSKWLRNQPACFEMAVVLLLTIVSLCIGALAIPAAVVASAIDAVIHILSAPVLAVALPTAFLSSPRYGPNIKLFFGLLTFPALVLGACVTAAALLVASSPLVAIGAAFMVVFDEDSGALVGSPVAASAAAIDVLFLSPAMHGYAGKLVAEWGMPLGPGEKPFDIRIFAALRNAAVVLVGGAAGVVLLTPLAAVLAVGGFLAYYRIAAEAIAEKPCRALIYFPLLAMAMGGGPLVAAAILVYLMLLGAGSGGAALSKRGHREDDAVGARRGATTDGDKGSHIVSDWWGVIGEAAHDVSHSVGEALFKGKFL